jgi:hypothetical protein
MYSHTNLVRMYVFRNSFNLGQYSYSFVMCRKATHEKKMDRGGVPLILSYFVPAVYCSTYCLDW